MLFLQKPSTATISTFLEAQNRLDFSYSAVGATATDPPAGYRVNHTRVKVGEGEVVFTAAKAAIQAWEQFNLGWVEAISPGGSLRPGEPVAVLARSFGLWWLNACRIVYVVNEQGGPNRFGFAYGTLPDHAGSGEESFLVEWDQESGVVWYDIFAFSRPQKFLARLGYLWLRRVQKRFGRESAAALILAVKASQLPSPLYSGERVG